MPDDVLEVLRLAAGAVAQALDEVDEWDEPGARPEQYACDIATDAAAFGVLDAAGFGIVSEERPAHRLDRDIVVVVDPVDGSANAVRGIPYYATSLCAVDAAGMLAAVVVNLATGTTFEAVRGQGARCDGLPLRVSSCTSLADAAVAVSGPTLRTRPWRHMRAFGATALELCEVAQGVLDAYINTDDDVTATWDYMGALLICAEAGAAISEGRGRPLVLVDPTQRRSPLVAGTPELLAEIQRYGWPAPVVPAPT